MNFNPNAFIENLKYMGIGMLSIGIVIAIIIGVTLLLNAVTKQKKITGRAQNTAVQAVFF